MCGIAGYFGKQKIPKKRIMKTLTLMKNRGPDYQAYKEYKVFDNYLYLLSSRLNIIDNNSRSNQPYIFQDYAIIFNGEIYNYLEVKKKLQKKGIKFNTTSDTEVLLKAYIFYGRKFLDLIEGMWSFVIFNNKNKKIFISRDRFGEKPLHYSYSKRNFYFASEIKFIKSLSNENYEINETLLLKFLILGYKALRKDTATFFKRIYEFPKSTYCVLDNSLKPNFIPYWSLFYRPKKISLSNAINKSKYFLANSLKIRMRADVPIAFSLSGGIDSNTLVGYAKKKFKKQIKCFSVIDKDKKFNEIQNINSTLKYLNCKSRFIKPPKKNALKQLKKLIEYHDSPILTINYLMHSYLAEKVSKENYRVLISGVGADEIFSGYYDHTLQFLYEIRNHKTFKKELNNWKKKISVHIRNPLFKNYNLYFDNPKFREHIYEHYKDKEKFLIKKIKDKSFKFVEKNNSKSLMRNRMYNELFHESVPVILNEEDMNCMYYSIENRSPYLDRKLVEFLYTVPTEILIQKGFTKFLLRKSANSYVNKKILKDTKKVGFNYSINSIFKFNGKNFKKEFLSKKNPIFKYIKYEEILELFKNNKKQKVEDKFIFNFISASLFLKVFS